MSKEKKYDIIFNDFGYFEVMPKPTKDELFAFYKEKYFQSGDRYDHEYDEEEKRYIDAIIRRKMSLLECCKKIDPTESKVLEIGVGEGWALNYLAKQGFEVLGVDFSDFAVKNHNPEIFPKLIASDPDAAVETLIEKGARFDLIWLDNVLEHSPAPKALLSNLEKISNAGAAIIIEVPNDYSLVQLECKKRDLIKSNFWECPPEHLSYFNLDGLRKLCGECGWIYKVAMTDFPIDIFLLNEAANYNKDPSVGKKAHRARVAFELMLSEQDDAKVIQFYQKLLDIGLGRQITAVFERAP